MWRNPYLWLLVIVFMALKAPHDLEAVINGITHVLHSIGLH